MKTKIITLLRERGDYVSGQELCERFGVSRTAVWKQIEQLKKDGYVIEAVKNRGYRLLDGETPRVFGYTEIQSRIQTEWAGRNLCFFDTTDSTNIRAKQLAEEGAPHGTLVVADQQTAGRGRRGRSWDSPAGENLYFTLLLRPQISPDSASMLTLVMALAVAEGLRRTCRILPEIQEAGTDVQIGIKWPNDIVADGRKVCGILTEMSLSVEQGSIEHVVIGVGINVMRQSFAQELIGKAAALEEFFEPISRSELLAAILEAFERAYKAFCAKGDLSDLKETYNALLVNSGRLVRVLDPKGEFEGTAVGIQNTGELIVDMPDGERRNIYAGEVSVRGICGYV